MCAMTVPSSLQGVAAQLLLGAGSRHRAEFPGTWKARRRHHCFSYGGKLFLQSLWLTKKGDSPRWDANNVDGFYDRDASHFF